MTSFCVVPIVPEIRAVSPTHIVIKTIIFKLLSKINDVRITRNTTAVTIVAAWISADKGVGTYIASGNNVCKPIWADLPIAPKNRKNKIKSNKFI